MNNKPYHFTQRKIILKHYVLQNIRVDLADEIISNIISYIYSSIIIKCRREISSRSFRLYNMDSFTYFQSQQEINKLIGFDLLSKINGEYKTYEINAIGSFFQFFDICQNDAAIPDCPIMSYKDFCLCEFAAHNIFYIKKMKDCMYDVILGFDILMLLIKLLYKIRYVKISKKKRERLKLNGVSIINI